MDRDINLNTLHKVLTEFGAEYPSLQIDNLFVLFFLVAHLTGEDQIELAAKSISGGTGDKGADAILIDHPSKSIFIIQGKLREKFGGKSEPRSDVLAFSQFAPLLFHEDKKSIHEYTKNANPETSKLIKSAHNYISNRNYKLRLIYVTTGIFSPSVKSDAEKIANLYSHRSRITFFDGTEVIRLLKDYLADISPQINSVDLEIESGQSIKLMDILQRYDSRLKIESWVFPMRGDKISKVYEEAGVRLFARNIRGFLGETPVNSAMSKTLVNEPDKFFYYNNGITIICDEAEKISSKGKEILRVNHPQVINGQQTTRSLAKDELNSPNASVLVKVIRVPLLSHNDNVNFENLVSQIVSGTNWQNTIKASDLMTNDLRQIELQREFRKLGYNYQRRRQSKRERAFSVFGKQYFSIKKEKLAQAVAGCDLDPVIPRQGMDNLFKEEIYTLVFPNTDPDFYLPRYWLMRSVTSHAKGYPERGYAKWLALGFVWKHIYPLVKTRRGSRAIRYAFENNVNSIQKPLGTLIEKTFVASSRFYSANKGTGRAAIDVSSFYKRSGRDKQFRVFWKTPGNRSRKGFDNALVKLKKALDNIE